MTRPNSAIVYRGISELDGVTPIVVVLTGLASDRTSNKKTGGMVQAYILVAGWSATDAVHNGTDFAICGDCKHRGDGTGKDRACYVSLATGLSAVSRGVQAGTYPRLSLQQAAVALAGRQLRLGTYGDPAAVPLSVWEALLVNAAGWTGYTHQWRTRPDLAALVMASVDTPEEYTAAKAAGWRTFRVRRALAAGVDPLLYREIVCPAGEEGGRRVTCEECQLCRGNARPAKDIAIIDHSVRGRAAVRRLNVLQGSAP